MFPRILKTNSFSVLVGGKSYVVDRTNPDWDAILKASEGDDEAALVALVDKPVMVAQALNTMGVDDIKVTENSVLWKGTPVDNYIVSRILEFKNAGLSFDPLVRFFRRLLNNPSYRAVQELYRFLEASDLPITEDGYFLAYKRITKEWKDCHSRTIDNSVGAKPRVERNQVDEDSTRTCSNGLHVCSRAYLDHFGGDRLILVKVDPADVVSIPTDYENSKMRVCGYEVLKELEDNRPQDWESPVYEDDDYDYDPGEDWDSDEPDPVDEEPEEPTPPVTVVQMSDSAARSFLAKLFGGKI